MSAPVRHGPPSSRTRASSCTCSLSDRPEPRALFARLNRPRLSCRRSAESAYETITYRDPQDHRIFEQSATDIWAAICKASNDVLRDSGVDPKAVKGVGFDATCSLVVTDLDGRPAEVSKGADLGLAKGGTVGSDHSVILWAGASSVLL